MLPALALALIVALGGCGDDDDHPASTPTPTGIPMASPTSTATVVPNHAPVLAPIGPQTVVAGEDLLLALSAVDPDGDPVTYSYSVDGVPAGQPIDAYFLPASGVFCIFPEVATESPIRVTFRASDGQLSDEETVSIRVVSPAQGGINEVPQLTLASIGNQTVHVGDTLRLQLLASGAEPIRYRMFPEPELAPLVTLDSATGAFQFTPSATDIGRTFEITFQACVPEGDGCSDRAQVHETVYLSVVAAGGTACPNYVPSRCDELPNTVPAVIDKCYKITKGGTYTSSGYVNIIENRRNVTNGALYIVEDPGKTIDIRVKSLLIEKGATLQAGSPECPFGKNGGKLSIGLYGDDPSIEGTVPTPPPGIQCMTEPRSKNSCFPSNKDFKPDKYYCTRTGTDDPCEDTTKPTANPLNKVLEAYGNLNFDPTPWGYKVLGVSYGGSLKLFGYKGAKPLQDAAWGKDYDSDTQCVAPKPAESTLDTAEMKAWANLSGSSWVRLQKIDGKVLTVDRAVKDWAPGDQIVVGTTDWYPTHNEIRTIREIDDSGTQITVCRPCASTSPSCDGKGPGGCATKAVDQDALDYPHDTQIFDAKTLDGAEYTEKLNRTAVDTRATVGLLSRSIQIRSLGATAADEFPAVRSDSKSCMLSGAQPSNHDADDCYFGGHTMVRQGFAAFEVQGVEFKQLGQGGRMGHYPVHFHLAKNTDYTQYDDGGVKKNKAFIKDSSMWDSMTRFAVLHGTQGVTVARNVGFLSMGHGFYLEDATEIDNRLCHNLAMSVRGSLKEFFNAQANPKNWKGTPAAPSLLARYVPPILDGVCSGPQVQNCICQHPKTVDNPTDCTMADDVRLPAIRTGSDAFMPVAFWAMNAANEFVGNAAVGVHGFGSCYWLLGSGVSGASLDHEFDGPDTPNNTGTVLANYNSVAKGYQAPLRRFRGNSCTTAALALPAQAEIPPAPIPFAGDPYSYNGYTAIKNPYLLEENGQPKPPSKLAGLFNRPAVQGNFQPIQPNKAGPSNSFFTNCAQTAKNVQNAEKDGLLPNTKSCVTTVLDRFSTSYNWTEVNFGSIWLRPWFYMLLNSAMTDQLFGGLTIVTAGSWIQVPPAYYSLAKDNLFVGTTQFGTGASRYARRSGPIFAVTKDDKGTYAPCTGTGGVLCNLDVEGVGIWSGAFNPKRLINIYDGPHFADGNLFLNVGAWECDPQPCEGKDGQCELPEGLPCGIYSSTREPAVKKTDGTVDRHTMVVLDAAVGWKQPNGFYYPPAFAYRAATFFKKIPDALKDLNMCYSFGADDGFKEPKLRPGPCRHNVVDRTRDYINGEMSNLFGGAQIAGPSNPSNPLPIGPIDFQTILIDLDASLTGASGIVNVSSDECKNKTCGAACTTPDGHKGKCAGTSPNCTTCQVTLPTTSLSRNAFFDAPSQGEECLSFGLQTSPYQFVTSVMAELENSPATTNPTYATKGDPNWPDRPGVAIYRQWKLNGEVDEAGQVCDAGIAGTERGTFMVGPNIYHSPTLTQSLPPDLNGQPGAIYYVDTSGSTNVTTFTGSATFTAPFTISGTGIGTGLRSGYSIDVQGVMKDPNKGPRTVLTVSPNSITVKPDVVAEGPINVTVNHQKQPTCFPSASPFRQATFLKNKTYVLYHLFARNDAVASYQLFVGDGVNSVDAIQGRFVRVNPRLVKGDTEASLVTMPCKPGDQSGWCKGLPTPEVKDGLLTFTLDQRTIAPDFVVASRADYERCMPRDMCYYNSSTKRCESCASATGDNKDLCIRQSDLAPDYPTLNLPDASGRNALDVACQDWSQLASGTTESVIGELTMADCPKDGCLGFAFTLPDNFVGDKTYNEVGAKHTECFSQAAWENDALVARTSGMKLADPLCGEPRQQMPSDFCGGTPGAPTATATSTPTGSTPTSTPTGGGGPTAAATPTPVVTATANATATGGVTPTATATGGATPTVTATETISPTPTVTPTSGGGGGFSWLVNGSPAMTVNVPLGGTGFAQGALVLVDGQMRFCTEAGLHPTLHVDTATMPIAGVFPGGTKDEQSIAAIPAGSQAGTADLLIETRLDCMAGSQTTTLRFSGAITYTAGP